MEWLCCLFRHHANLVNQLLMFVLQLTENSMEEQKK